MMFAFSIDYESRFLAGGWNRFYGFIEADNEEQALEKLWEKAGNDYACRPRVYPITGDYFMFGLFD